MNNEENKIHESENTQPEREEAPEQDEMMPEAIEPDMVAEDNADIEEEPDFNEEIKDKSEEDTESEYQNEFTGGGEEYLYEDEEPKKSGINTSLKIAGAILVAFAAVFAIYMFVFNPTPEKALKNSGLLGTWINRNGDIVAFYEFEEDGKLTLTTGTLENISGFAIDPDTDKTFYVYTYGEDPAESKTGSLQYDVYKEDGVETLKIFSRDIEGSEFYLQRSELPDDFLKPDENFKYDENICGEWHNDENNLSIKFGKDGLIVLDFSSVVYNATYVLEDGRVDFTYYKSFSEDSKATESFYYQLDGNKLKFYTSQPTEDAQAVEFVKVDNKKA